jgi:hypothetical protein
MNLQGIVFPIKATVADLRGRQHIFEMQSTDDFEALDKRIRSIINAGVNDELDLTYKTIWTKATLVLGLGTEGQWQDAINIARANLTRQKSSPYQLEIMHSIKSQNSVSQGKGKKKDLEQVRIFYCD